MLLVTSQQMAPRCSVVIVVVVVIASVKDYCCCCRRCRFDCYYQSTQIMNVKEKGILKILYVGFAEMVITFAMSHNVHWI